MTIRFQKLNFTLLLVFVAGVFSAFQTLHAQQTQDAKKLNQAMGFKPKFASELTYEQPNAAVLKGCKLERTKNPPGFVVYHETGRVLRKFIDTNKDEKLDQWSYYNEGLEVYRDVDSNFDENLDQYRWIGPAGTRWGVDRNQDGAIDYWKVISPEEVAYECFQAIKKRDQNRFNRLLLSEAELKSLGLNEAILKDVYKRWKTARSQFATMAGSQKTIGSRSKWVYAGNGQPAMMSASDGNKKDLVIYDHASGFFENGSNTQQVALGSMIKVGEGWRMVELPEIVDPKQPLDNGGAFFPREDWGRSKVTTGPLEIRLTELLNQLDKAEKSLVPAKGVAVERGERAKADVLIKLVGLYNEMKDPVNAANWQENLADSVCSAYQKDRFTEGINYLNRYMLNNKGASGLDYVKWRAIFAEYAWVDVNGTKAQKTAAREKLVGELEAFQETYATSKFTPDALVQLGVHYEVNEADQPKKAMKWYNQCAQRFPSTGFGKRSAGALIRLDSFGKTFPFVGKIAAVGGQKPSTSKFDIGQLKGKIVVLHFWETWCCSDNDIKELARLQGKFSGDIAIVGCNIEGATNGGTDADATREFSAFVNRNKKRMTWTQLHAPGGVDGSPLAQQFGIATEPTVVLVDRNGKLVETNISLFGGALEREIERERRRK